GGLLVEIMPPELETRMSILGRRFDELGVQAPSELTYFIANGIRTNARSLEGAARKLVAYCQTMGAPLTIDTASDVLSDYMVSASASTRAWMRKGVSIESVVAA